MDSAISSGSSPTTTSRQVGKHARLAVTRKQVEDHDRPRRSAPSPVVPDRGLRTVGDDELVGERAVRRRTPARGFLIRSQVSGSPSRTGAPLRRRRARGISTPTCWPASTRAAAQQIPFQLDTTSSPSDARSKKTTSTNELDAVRTQKIGVTIRKINQGRLPRSTPNQRRRVEPAPRFEKRSSVKAALDKLVQSRASSESERLPGRCQRLAPREPAGATSSRRAPRPATYGVRERVEDANDTSCRSSGGRRYVSPMIATSSSSGHRSCTPVAPGR